MTSCRGCKHFHSDPNIEPCVSCADIPGTPTKGTRGSNWESDTLEQTIIDEVEKTPTLTLEEAMRKVALIIGKIPYYEDNVKRFHDILTLVRGWEINSLDGVKNDPVMESQMGIRWMEDDESK